MVRRRDPRERAAPWCAGSAAGCRRSLAARAAAAVAGAAAAWLLLRGGGGARRARATAPHGDALLAQGGACGSLKKGGALPESLTLYAPRRSWPTDGAPPSGAQAAARDAAGPTEVLIGVFTSHGARGAARRGVARATWLRAALSERPRVVARFVLGDCDLRASAEGGCDEAAVAREEAEAEAAGHAPFLRLRGHAEEYSALPFKTHAFMMAALEQHPSAEWIVKADDDTYLFAGRLRFMLASLMREGHRAYLAARRGSSVQSLQAAEGGTAAGFAEAVASAEASDRAASSLPLPADAWQREAAYYVGCMKKGWPMPEGSKWHEPWAGVLGKKQFPAHAWGPVYALSSNAARAVAAQSGLRYMSNEDLTVGVWMLGLNVTIRDERRLCHSVASCARNSLAVYDIPKCSGLCHPEESMPQIHASAQCQGGGPLEWEQLSAPEEGYLRYAYGEWDDDGRNTPRILWGESG